MPPAANPPMKPEISSAAQLLARIIALIDALVAVMDEEIPLVEQRQRAQHAELLKRKQRLTLDYRASLKTVVMDPNLLLQIPEDLRAKARAAADRLAEASQRNARALRAIMTASQRLVQAIVAIVRGETLPKNTYNHAAAIKASGGYSPICKPVTVRRTV